MAIRFNLENLGLACFVGGGAVAIASDRFGWQTAKLVGLTVVLLGALFWGLDMVLKRRAEISAEEWGKRAFEVYRGIPAVAWGLGVSLMSGLIIWFSIPELLGEEHTTIFHRHPGLILAVLGAVIALFGIGQAGRATVRMEDREIKVWRWDMRIGGVFSALFGTIICIVGLATTVAPDWFWSTVRAGALALLDYLSR